MISFYLKHFRLLRVSGITLPFVIHTGLHCFIDRSAHVSLKSRVHFGNKKLVSLSAVKANVQFDAGSEIHVGHSVSIGPGVNLIVKQNAKLNIGDNTYFTSDSHIEASNNLKIGSDCAISWGVTILDSDHHTLTYAGQVHKPSETVIGNQVWIGCNATILKGSFIGNGSVVAAGSVVSGHFPDNSLIGGNPARVLRENISWR